MGARFIIPFQIFWSLTYPGFRQRRPPSIRRCSNRHGVRRRCSSLYDETLAALIRLFLLLPSSSFRGPAPSGHSHTPRDDSTYALQQQQWTEVKQPVHFCNCWVDFVVGTSCSTKSLDDKYNAAASS